ncbi:MAG: tyrosine-type recombinase/integrase [Geminicoccaceae bacterium]
MRMKLNQRVIERLATPDRETFIWHEDLEGFGVRMYPSGRTLYVVQYKQDGVTRRTTVGNAALVEFDDALSDARVLLARASKGSDPIGEERAAKAAAKAAEVEQARRLSFAMLVEEYLRLRGPELRERSLQETTRHLRVHMKPLHGTMVEKLERRDYSAQFRKIAEGVAASGRGSGVVAANRVKSSTSAMLSWAVDQGLLQANPIAGMKKMGAEASRDRVLSLAEIADIWRHAGEEGSAFADLVRALVLSGCRRDELADLGRDEVDLDKGAITIPARRMKARQPHVVLMAPALQSIVERRIAGLGGGERFVFGVPALTRAKAGAASEQRSDGFSAFSGSMKRLRGRLARAGIQLDRFTLHDARRAMSTHLHELGVPPLVVEAMLAHTVKGVAAVYNRAEHTQARRDAWARWADMVMEAVGTMPMQQAAPVAMKLGRERKIAGRVRKTVGHARAA